MKILDLDEGVQRRGVLLARASGEVTHCCITAQPQSVQLQTQQSFRLLSILSLGRGSAGTPYLCSMQRQRGQRIPFPDGSRSRSWLWVPHRPPHRTAWGSLQHGDWVPRVSAPRGRK